jgi:hypothetical protein
MSSLLYTSFSKQKYNDKTNQSHCHSNNRNRSAVLGTNLVPAVAQNVPPSQIPSRTGNPHGEGGNPETGNPHQAGGTGNPHMISNFKL